MKQKRLFMTLILSMILCPSAVFCAEQNENAAIDAGTLTDGAYMVDIESDLPVLEADKGVLTVRDGGMTLLFQAGKNCSALFSGDALSASEADDKEILKPLMNQTFSIGTEVLDTPAVIAVLDASDRKWHQGYLTVLSGQIPEEAYESGALVTAEVLDTPAVIAVLDASDRKWHQGYLTVLSGQIPEEAYESGALVTAEDLGLSDGVYSAEVSLRGGSGKASVNSPALLEIRDGRITAEIIWSSSHYDYMLVHGTRYDRQNPEGNSVFRIPVDGFDADLKVIGDTLAMSRPHEIEYMLRFDSRTVTPVPAD